MNLPHFALRHRSIILAFVVVFLVIGTFNFATMPRREDPELTIRDALIVTAWPGASATRVEELITDPIEDVIVEIEEVETVKSKSMVGLSIVQVSASDDITETDQVWDDVPISIERRYEEPARSLTRVTTAKIAHQAAIVIGVSMKSGRNVAQMSTAVDRVIDNLSATVIPPDLVLSRVNDLPRQVNTRIVDFQFNLVQGVLIVLAVALLTMGWRPALIMATAVPLSLFGGALWAPMTNGMIFGLIVSTGLTLFVIPSLYVVMVEKTGMTVFSGALDSDQTSENGRQSGS